MASHVVVIDSTARRHTIKTTPAKHLSDVLQEACSKFGLNPDQYALKHNNKPVDLSRTIRLSGLSSGAKLDLVQGSRSPSIVSVALQLPTEDGDTGASSRLTDKFPSNTSIWQILRRFEAGAAGAGTAQANHNFTQRATPLMSSGSSGAGRLCYEMPVINIMGRDLGSFVDLQKTLGQLGFGSGSCLLRLSYRKTEQPLEEAMTEISQYFKALEEPVLNTTTDTHGAHGRDVGTLESTPDITAAETVPGVAGEPVSTQDTPMTDAPSTETEPLPTFSDPASNASTPAENITQTPTTTLAATPDLIIYAPPTSNIPTAANPTDFDETDYIPTVDHAKSHQALLQRESRNRRLLSDSELAAQVSARSATLADISHVLVRLRFPDQSQAQQEYGRDATTGSLFETCRNMMHRPKNESFSLRVPAAAVSGAGNSKTPGGMAVLREDSKRLITELGWQGRVLVTVVWGDDVGMEVRRGPSLKEEFRAKAESLKAELPKEIDSGNAKAISAAAPSATAAGEGGKPQPAKEAKMMKFLKGLSKK